MKTLLKKTLCTLLCLAIIGNAACTTTYIVDASAGAVAEHSIKAGDKVELQFADYTSTEVTVTAIDDDGISGTDTDGNPVTADYDELNSVVFTGIDGGKTAKNAGKAVGIAALAVVVAGAMAATAMSGAMVPQ